MAKKKYPISLKEVEAEYQELSARMNYDGSNFLPRIIKKALTLEQARVALEFYNSNEEIAAMLGIPKETVEKDPQKHQVEAITKKLKLDKETVEKHVQYMFELGFAFPTRRGWRFARNMMQLKDSMTNPKFDEQLGDEFFDLWEAFQKIEAYPTWYLWNYAKTEEFGPIFRIIPAQKALKMSGIPYEDIVPWDNLAEILKQFSIVAVEHCPCARLVRDRACHKPTELCLIMDRVAEHNLRRGAARVISVDEAVAIHDMATDFGAACVVQGAIEMKQYPGGGRQERLKAWVDPDKCVGCGLCVTTCPVEARTLTMVRIGEEIPEKPILAAYTAAPPYKEGKHLDTGSVMIRPIY